MSYEYSNSSQRLNLPTPFRIENIALFVSAAALIIFSFALLLQARSGLSSQNWLSLLPIAVAVFMLVKAAQMAAKGFSQLRFFFGRGEPNSLAEDGDKKNRNFRYNASELSEIIRQNALEYVEPKGPINGILYSWFANLVYAPDRIRYLTESFFGKIVVSTVVLISFVFSAFTVQDSSHRGWVSLVFILMSIELIVPTLTNAGAGRGGISTVKLIVLTLIGIFLPVGLVLIDGGKQTFLSQVDLSFFWGNSIMLLMVLGSALIFSLFILALYRRLDTPPQMADGCHVTQTSFNAHPKQLADELDREMMKNWTEGIPNRVYTRTFPSVSSGESGSFSCEFLEETQPIPESGEQDMSVKELAFSSQTFLLTILNALGVLLIVIAAVSFYMFGSSVARNIEDPTWLNPLGFGIVLLLLGQMAIGSASHLWGQFKFKSQLMWFEFFGNWTRVKFDYGNQFVDRTKTERSTINIETATLRVWTVDLETVSFGKTDTRFITGMVGNKDKSRYIANHLNNFGQEQAVISAPTSSRDVERIANLAAINNIGGNGAGNMMAKLTGDMHKSMSETLAPRDDSDNTLVAVEKNIFCTECGNSMPADSKFCPSCGHPQ